MKATCFRLVSGNRGQYALVALLLLILAAELAFTARRESQTVDEAIHIYAGYLHWCGDYGINPEHPPLAKLVATIPLLFDHPKNLGPTCGSDNSDKSGNFAMGRQFLYSNDARKILTETRSFIGLFPLFLAPYSSSSRAGECLAGGPGCLPRSWLYSSRQSSATARWSPRT
jgi:hypothetical protein